MEIQYLHAEERDGSEQINGWLEIHKFLLGRSREVVAVHGQINSQRIVQLVQQFDKLFFLSFIKKVMFKCRIKLARTMKISGHYLWWNGKLYKTILLTLARVDEETSSIGSIISSSWLENVCNTTRQPTSLLATRYYPWIVNIVTTMFCSQLFTLLTNRN